MKIIFCGGGTAGHVMPSVAMAEELCAIKNTEFAFIGRKDGKENAVIEKNGWKLYTIDAESIRMKFSKQNFNALIKLFRSVKEAKNIFKEYSPDIVIGTGGYVCFPVLYAARKLKIKYAIQESNSVAGKTTRVFARKSEAIFASPFLCDKKILGLPNVKILGNPTRKEIGGHSKKTARENIGIPENCFMILSVGGSGGADFLNKTSIQLMKKYSLRDKNVFHIHATGLKYYSDIEEEEKLLCKHNGRCRIIPYLDNMADYLKAADIVITRCGAITLSEIAISAAIPIMIPSPNVTDNHQYKNAMLLRERCAGVLIEEKELSQEKIIAEIEKIRNDYNLRKSYKTNLTNLARPQARRNIIDEILLLL